MLEGMLPVEERESLCYKYFNQYKIETREQLRECLNTNPIKNVRKHFVEDIFSDMQEIKKEQERKRLIYDLDKNYHQTFVISDIHIPFQDDKSVNLVFECISDAQPKNLVLLGDILDCYSVSRFLKKPTNYMLIQDEINIFYKYMKKLRKLIPNTNIFMILGNHEARLSTLAQKDDNHGLYGLKVLQPEHLFRLDELGIEYREKKIVLDDFIYYHGDKVSSKSSYTAKAEYEDHNCHSGVSGHTHRLGSYYSSYEQKVGQWYENGCLCQLNPEYINDPDKANWQQGFTIINSYEGFNQGVQILIQNHQFSYNGKIYK